MISHFLLWSDLSPMNIVSKTNRLFANLLLFAIISSLSRSHKNINVDDVSVERNYQIIQLTQTNATL
jgi:hypothetical protein